MIAGGRVREPRLLPFGGPIEYAAHGARQNIPVVWLRDHRPQAGSRVLAATGEQHPASGLKLPGQFCQLLSGTPVVEIYVREEDVELAVLKRIRCVLEARGGRHVVAQIGKLGGDQFHEVALVVDDENALGAIGDGLGGAAGLTEGGRFLQRGQKHRDLGACARLALDLKSPAGRGHEPRDGGKAEAGATRRRLGCEMGFKNPCPDLGRHARPRIAHADGQ